MTHQQLTNLLSLYDPQVLHGTVRDKAKQFYSITGVTWRELLQAFADLGYRWSDAAKALNCHKAALYSFAYRQKATFPFQGLQGWKYREGRSAAMEGCAPFYRPPKKLYTAFGETLFAEELIAKYAHPTVNRHVFQCRVNIGWPTEDALTLPKGMPTGKGSWRIKAQQQKLQQME